MRKIDGEDFIIAEYLTPQGESLMLIGLHPQDEGTVVAGYLLKGNALGEGANNHDKLVRVIQKNKRALKKVYFKSEYSELTTTKKGRFKGVKYSLRTVKLKKGDDFSGQLTFSSLLSYLENGGAHFEGEKLTFNAGFHISLPPWPAATERLAALEGTSPAPQLPIPTTAKEFQAIVDSGHPNVRTISGEKYLILNTRENKGIGLMVLHPTEGLLFTRLTFKKDKKFIDDLMKPSEERFLKTTQGFSETQVGGGKYYSRKFSRKNGGKDHKAVFYNHENFLALLDVEIEGNELIAVVNGQELRYFIPAPPEISKATEELAPKVPTTPAEFRAYVEAKKPGTFKFGRRDFIYFDTEPDVGIGFLTLHYNGRLIFGSLEGPVVNAMGIPASQVYLVKSFLEQIRETQKPGHSQVVSTDEVKIARFNKKAPIAITFPWEDDIITTFLRPFGKSGAKRENAVVHNRGDHLYLEVKSDPEKDIKFFLPGTNLQSTSPNTPAHPTRTSVPETAAEFKAMVKENAPGIFYIKNKPYLLLTTADPETSPYFGLMTLSKRGKLTFDFFLKMGGVI